jgi:hypothetical protein
MPIDLYNSLKNTSQWAFGSPLLNSILGSSLFVAIFIALFMVLLIMIMYPAKSGTSLSVVFKMFIYMFMGTLLVVFLHDGVIKYMIREEIENKQYEEVVNNATKFGGDADPVYGSSYKIIQPGENERLAVPLSPSPANTEQPTKQKPVFDEPVIARGGSDFILDAPKPASKKSEPFR